MSTSLEQSKLMTCALVDGKGQKRRMKVVAKVIYTTNWRFPAVDPQTRKGRSYEESTGSGQVAIFVYSNGPRTPPSLVDESR